MQDLNRKNVLPNCVQTHSQRSQMYINLQHRLF